MTDRTVKVNLVAGTGAYNAPIKDASATTLKLALAQKEQAASAKAAAAETVKASEQIAIADKQAALTAAQSAAQVAVGEEAQVAAKKAVEAASKDLAKQEAASAKAITAAQRDSAAAGKEVVAAQQAIDDAAKKTGQSYTDTGKKMMTAGLVMVGAFAVAEKATTAFEDAMSGVKAVANATASQMDQLRAAALQAGKDTAFTATQAAQAEGELVRAGVSVSDILGGALKGSLSLAAAGGLDLAQSATIAANAMNTFGLKGKDVSHIADVLASGANKSAADVQSLAYGMSQGGLVAAQMGLDLTQTTAILSAFADRGLQGADAGTSMKTMLERLAAPTGAAAKLMNQLGIETYDSSGKFVGAVQIAGQLHDKLSGLSEAQRNSALQTIFGTDAIRGANVMYSLGAQGMQGYIDAMNDSGAAGRMASTQMDNLSGDLKQLRGSIDVALIQGGSGGNEVLRELTQTATKAVNAFAGLPKPLQETVTGMVGGSGAALLLVGSLTSAAGKVGAMRKTLSELEETATGAKGALAKVGSFMTGPWGLAIAGAATVIGIFASKTADAKVQVADFTEAIKQDGGALGAQTSAAVAADLANRKVYDAFGKVGVSMDTVTKAAMGNTDAMKQVEQATAASAKTNFGAGVDLLKSLNIIEATSQGLHDQQRAQLQATAAAQDATAANGDQQSSEARLAQSAKEVAAGAMQRTAAARAEAEAARAEAADTDTATKAAKGSTAAKGASTKATKDATAATKADEAAQKAHLSAQKAANSAALDSAKAAAADAKAQGAAANAADAYSYANSTAAGAAKSSTAATKDKTAAQNADTRSANASISATQAATRAKDADARAAAAHAKATSDAAKAATGDAAAQAAAAEAAREAALDHKIGAEALKAWAAAAADTSDSTNTLDDSVTAEVAAMKDAQDTANGLKDALDALDGVHISAGRAAVDVQDKIAALTKSLHDNGNALDITTQAGRDNTKAIYDTADAILQHAQAVTQETGSVEAGNKSLAASRDEFDKVLAAAGLGTDAIRNFNDTILAIPKTATLTLSVDSATALAKLQQFKNAAGDLVAVHIGGSTGKAAYATGGRVVGSGTTTSDSIPARLSRDEYVIKASAAARIGYAELDRLNFGGAPRTLVRAQMISNVGGTSAHAAGGAAGAPMQLVAGPGGDSAVATMINYLIRTNAIQIVR